MRHSRRADKDGTMWKESDVRTWDPPLSDQGIALLQQTIPVLQDILFSVEKIVTSPFLRCLQTSEAIRKAFELHPSLLEIDLSLSEIYDYFNSVRLVDSPDIWRDGSYVNMSEWFFKKKYRNIEEGRNHLIETTSIKEIMAKHVDDVFANENVSTKGYFPDFERYVPNPFMISTRFCDAFSKATDENNGNLIFVTHMSGVISIINNIFGYVRFYVLPCDFIVLERTRQSEKSPWTKWNLLNTGELISKAKSTSTTHLAR